MAGAALFQIGCPVVIARQVTRRSGSSRRNPDAAKFRAVALRPGTPYRDFKAQYPPLALGLFHAIGPRSFNGFRERLFALQVACQALIVLLLLQVLGHARGRGRT